MKTTADKSHKLPIFEKRFLQLREEKDMSQDAFAKFLGISRPTVGFYENGDRIPDALILEKIARKCEVPSDWLLGLSESDTASYALIEHTTGLTPEAIDLLNLSCDEGLYASNKVVVNAFITCGFFMKMLEQIAANIEALETLCSITEELRETTYKDASPEIITCLTESENSEFIERSRYRFLRDVEHIYDAMIIQLSEKYGPALVEAKRKEMAWLDEFLERQSKRKAKNQED